MHNQRRSDMQRRSGVATPCPVPDCGGNLVAYRSMVIGVTRVRYLHCNCCGHLPSDNVVSIPLEFAPPRKPRK